MSADLRALLREARDMMLSWPTQTQKAARRREELCKSIDAALSEPEQEPPQDASPRKIGGPFIPQEIARNARNAASGKPILYLCPAGCGCTWRDNDDGSMSLGLRQRSCEVCEFLPLDKLVALYIALPPASPSDARDAARYLEALTKIASYCEGPIVDSSFDEPESAKIARAAIEREGGING